MFSGRQVRDALHQDSLTPVRWLQHGGLGPPAPGGPPSSGRRGTSVLGLGLQGLQEDEESAGQAGHGHRQGEEETQQGQWSLRMSETAHQHFLQPQAAQGTPDLKTVKKTTVD